MYRVPSIWPTTDAPVVYTAGLKKLVSHSRSSQAINGDDVYKLQEALEEIAKVSRGTEGHWQ